MTLLSAIVGRSVFLFKVGNSFRGIQVSNSSSSAVLTRVQLATIEKRYCTCCKKIQRTPGGAWKSAPEDADFDTPEYVLAPHCPKCAGSIRKARDEAEKKKDASNAERRLNARERRGTRRGKRGRRKQR